MHVFPARFFFSAILAFVLGAGLIAPVFGIKSGQGPAQKDFPDPPGDATRVYYLGTENKLLMFPFEQAANSIDVHRPAKADKVVRLQITGRTAATTLAQDNLKFYVFVADRMDPPPHQLVRLASKQSRRELAISLIKGRKGYGPFENDHIGLERRLIDRLEVQTSRNRIMFVNYMQMRPVKPLEPGEYAIIGDSLADMATFRIQ